MAEDRPQSTSYPFPLPEDFVDAARDEEDNGGVSVFAIVNHLLRYGKWILGIPLLALVVTTAYMETREHDFVADSRFLPADGDFSVNADAGVFSQLNRLVGGGRGGTDGMFYSFLAQSNAFLRPAARTAYEFERPIEDGGGEGETEVVRGTLAQIHGIEAADENMDVRASLGILKSMVSSRVDPGTGFVAISVKAPWPGLAVAVNERLLELVNEFNVEQRQLQAASEREFVETRMAAAQEELEEAEAELVAFLETNQRYDQSPRLRYEFMRLESEVDLRRGLYSSLARAYDQARISEVRNTPVVTIVEHPSETVSRPGSGGAPLRYGIMAFLIAALLTIGAIGIRIYLARQTESHPDDFEKFRRVVRSSLPGRLGSQVSALRGRDNGSGRVAAGSTASQDPPESW